MVFDNLQQKFQMHHVITPTILIDQNIINKGDHKRMKVLLEHSIYCIHAFLLALFRIQYITKIQSDRTGS